MPHKEFPLLHRQTAKFILPLKRHNEVHTFLLKPLEEQGMAEIQGTLAQGIFHSSY